MAFTFVNCVSLKLPAGVYRASSKSRLSSRRAPSMSSLRVALSDKVDVHVVPILSDNFSYVIHDKGNNTGILVDAAEPRKLLDVCKKLNATVKASLTTHHHWDHAGGNDELSKLVSGVQIIGSAVENKDGVNVRLQSGQSHQVKGSSVTVRALSTPCHTMGHVCFTTNTERKAVFTGDTLFVGGCGKFFEGDASDMERSLNSVLGGLEDDTLVFCGHEYTVSNLMFAKSVDGDNECVVSKLEWAKQQVKEGLPTVPSTIGEEKKFNPFMRTGDATVAAAVGVTTVGDRVAVMRELRERKNRFSSKL